jgi:hypothetical protein
MDQVVEHLPSNSNFRTTKKNGSKESLIILPCIIKSTNEESKNMKGKQRSQSRKTQQLKKAYFSWQEKKYKI